MFAKLLLVAGLLAWGAAASGAPRQIVPLYPGKVVSFFLDETSLSKADSPPVGAAWDAVEESSDGSRLRVLAEGKTFWVPKREVKFSSSVDVESICLTAMVQVATAVTRNANEGCVKK